MGWGRAERSFSHIKAEGAPSAIKESQTTREPLLNGKAQYGGSPLSLKAHLLYGDNLVFFKNTTIF